MKAPDRAPAKGRVLIVDDEEHIREILSATLEPLVEKVFTVGSVEEAVEALKEENLDVVLCDIQMPGMSGLEFLRKVKAEQPSVKFLMITAHGTLETAVQAMRYGASDFLTKPFENQEVRNIVRRLLIEKQGSPDSGIGLSESIDFEGVIGGSPLFLECMEIAAKAALSDSSVLITGESGTGKEVLARFIHNKSGRADKPFVAVNCGAIPENLMESELFGHEKGSFTGAIASKPGKFTIAHNGTIFLDEMGEMPLSMQVKLLRVLQEKVIEPVGSLQPKKVDFRLVAATNRSLKEEIVKGNFREDLYYRLGIIPIHLPPLRERRQDVLLLARHFLAYFNSRYACDFILSAENHAQLMDYSWPGNIRELANSIERAVVLGAGRKLEFAFDASSSHQEIKPGGMKEKRQAVEREEILKALELNRWNKTQTADFLGISRRSLLYKVKEFGIA